MCVMAATNPFRTAVLFREKTTEYYGYCCTRYLLSGILLVCPQNETADYYKAALKSADTPRCALFLLSTCQVWQQGGSHPA